MADHACLICGITDEGVLPRLSHWEATATTIAWFNVTPRCTDTHACQARCIGQGLDWPLTPTHDTDPLLLYVPRAKPAAPDPEPEPADPWASFLEVGA